MNITGEHTSVLIVGAGPSGLMMAAQLLRYGIIPIIIDSKQGPTSHSKALVVQARSMEIYRQMGIVDKVLESGKQAQSFTFFNGDSEQATLNINSIAGVDTRYPYLFVYPQSSNERALLDYLTLNCCPVYWDTALTGLTQTGAMATATLQHNGLSKTITANWVIGADGAHSLVRKSLNIPFNGDTYKQLFYLIDAKVTNIADSSGIRVHLSKQGLTGFFPMSGQGNYRIIGNLPHALKNRADQLQLADILPLLKQVTGTGIEVTQCRWIITYQLHHRMADSFKQGRCFLIGDAAHIHSPVGGQGMNTGLQDAYNLAWKLAAVINNNAKPGLLNSYADERMPIAKTLLKTTDRAFNLAIATNPAARVFRQYVLPKLIAYLWQQESVKTYFFGAVSQTSINYRNSKLNLHLSQSKNIKAGDRLPSLTIFDEKKLEETDLHQWCFKPGFTLLILGKVLEEELFKIAKWLAQNYINYVHFCYLPPSAKNQQVFDAFEISKGQHKSILVRPDMHIGYMNDAIDLDRMDRYMATFAPPASK